MAMFVFAAVNPMSLVSTGSPQSPSMSGHGVYTKQGKEQQNASEMAYKLGYVLLVVVFLR